MSRSCYQFRGGSCSIVCADRFDHTLDVPVTQPPAYGNADIGGSENIEVGEPGAKIFENAILIISYVYLRDINGGLIHISPEAFHIINVKRVQPAGTLMIRPPLEQFSH